MKKTLYLLLTAVALLATPASAARNKDAHDTASKHKRTGLADHTMGILRAATAGMEFRLKAGIAIGGTAPLPIPLNIREVTGFDPRLNLNIEAEFVQDFNGPIGFSTGLRLETKGMNTTARVENYSMSMVSEGQTVKGVWWGMVETQVSNSYLTLPILFLWKPSPRWDLKVGPYGSFVMGRQFIATVYDGYLREGSPVGDKIEIIERTSTDFSHEISRWDFGLQLAADWRAFPHLLVGVDLTWGLKDMFKRDFETIAFPMYPIFARLNFGYAF